MAAEGTPPDILTRALRDLHTHAGNPPYHAISTHTRIPRTTTWSILNGRTVPTWERLRILILYLGGNPTHLKHLWAAAAHYQATAPRPTPITTRDLHTQLTEIHAALDEIRGLLTQAPPLPAPRTNPEPEHPHPRAATERNSPAPSGS